MTGGNKMEPYRRFRSASVMTLSLLDGAVMFVGLMVFLHESAM